MELSELILLCTLLPLILVLLFCLGLTAFKKCDTVFIRNPKTGPNEAIELVQPLPPPRPETASMRGDATTTSTTTFDRFSFTSSFNSEDCEIGAVSGTRLDRIMPMALSLGSNFSYVQRAELAENVLVGVIEGGREMVFKTHPKSREENFRYMIMMLYNGLMQNPHAVPISGFDIPRRLLMMPYYPEGDLDTFFSKHCHTLLPSVMFDILRQVSIAVEHLHFKDIVHLDVKSKNVLVDTVSYPGKFHLRLTDFELARSHPTYTIEGISSPTTGFTLSILPPEWRISHIPPTKNNNKKEKNKNGECDDGLGDFNPLFFSCKDIEMLKCMDVYGIGLMFIGLNGLCENRNESMIWEFIKNCIRRCTEVHPAHRLKVTDLVTCIAQSQKLFFAKKKDLTD